MKKKWMIVSSCLLIFMIGLGVVYLNNQKEEQIEDDQKIHFDYEFAKEDHVENIEWIGVAEDGVSTCIVQYDKCPFFYNVVPGRYIIEFSESWSRKYIGYEEGFAYEYDYSESYVYDIETGERRELFDFMSLMEQYPDMQMSDSLISGCFVLEDGSSIYQRIIEPRAQVGVSSDERDPDYIWVNIEDGSYSIEEERIKEEPWNRTSIFIYLEDDRLLKNNLPNKMLEEMSYTYASPYKNYEGVFEVCGLAEYLPRKNEALYSLFPELEQYRGEENCYIYMLIGGNPSDEELLRLFMEDGQQISFSGGLLSGQYTIDGEDHEIYSFEDYERWRAYEE